VSDTSTNGRWRLSPIAFDRFLAALDADRDAAAERYEQIRSKLLRFFEWRGCQFPEEHTDETMTRVMRKLDEGEEIRDASTYCYGVARLVLLEAHKQQDKQREALESFSVSASVALSIEASDIDRRLGCLEACMSALPARQRELVVEYYRNDKGARIDARKGLAEKLGIGMNALRIRAHRLSDGLQGCVRGCVERPGS